MVLDQCSGLVPLEAAEEDLVAASAVEVAASEVLEAVAAVAVAPAEVGNNILFNKKPT